MSLQVLTEAYYYYVDPEDPNETTELEGFSKEINFNTADFIERGEFNPRECHAECHKKCKKLRAEGSIPPRDDADGTVDDPEDLEGVCFYRIQDGLPNTLENWDLVCVCDPLILDEE